VIRLVVVPVAAALVLAAPASGGHHDPAFVQVAAREFSFSLSRSGIKPGPAAIEMVNFGADPHNLVIRRLKDGAVLGNSGAVLSGARGEIDLKLKPGKYVLYCSFANHEALGMSATLKVKDEPPPE